MSAVSAGGSTGQACNASYRFAVGRLVPIPIKEVCLLEPGWLKAPVVLARLLCDISLLQAET
jgi:hypothetical protein